MTRVTDVAAKAPLPRADDAPPPVALTEPREGVPEVVTTPEALAATVAAMAAGSGPVAVDAERASGYRYGQRAYLVQLRRDGAGTALIDPIAVPDLSSLGAVIGGEEWVLHAANQDLPCLAELGLRPERLFDTELAGRLAGYERVGLGTLVEVVLGYTLEKGHSAADWSTRPLPEPWLRYAALDVEVLIELRDALDAELERQGKREWAAEEFAAIVAAEPPPPRKEPWRRTSGIHRVRGPRQLAGVRALWELRDNMARDRDLAPGRLIPDSALVAAVLAAPADVAALTALPVWGGRQTRRLAPTFFARLEEARALPASELPAAGQPGDGPPPANRWADRDPVAAARLAAARAALQSIATEHGLPLENLLSPDAVRRLAWSPPDPPSEQRVAAVLRAAGARQWQLGLTVPALAEAMTATPNDDS